MSPALLIYLFIFFSWQLFLSCTSKRAFIFFCFLYLLIVSDSFSWSDCVHAASQLARHAENIQFFSFSPLSTYLVLLSVPCKKRWGEDVTPTTSGRNIARQRRLARHILMYLSKKIGKCIARWTRTNSYCSFYHYAARINAIRKNEVWRIHFT